jgi:DNA (cytosine-5)-methyltransferase 1
LSNIKTIKLFDSFAGIGALHKALTRLNIPIELVGISEIDIDAILSYDVIHSDIKNEIDTLQKEDMQKYLMDRNIGFDFKTNKSKIPKLKQNRLEQLYKACIRTKNFGDISKLNYETLPDFDLFNFSFPCTDISVAGKQQGMKDEHGGITRSGLYIYGMNVIKNKKPKYIMIENVKNLVSKKFIDNFNEMVQELDMVGYNVYWKVLNAKNFGIPQNRERVFAICIRKDVDNRQFNFTCLKNEIYNKNIYIKDLLENKVNEKYYVTSPKAILEEKRIIKENIWNKLDYSIQTIGQTSNEGSQCNKVISSYGIFQTICACTHGYALGYIFDKNKIRRLTPLEVFKLMGFDTEDYNALENIKLSDTQLYKQAGNSIVVNVLEYIFANLFKKYIEIN